MSEIVKRLRKAHDENMDRSFSPPLETQISVDFHYAALKIEDLEAENARLTTALENARKDALEEAAQRVERFTEGGKYADGWDVDLCDYLASAIRSLTPPKEKAT